jgi:hypothetical protein
VVGGTRFELVTPTMSKRVPLANGKFGDERPVVANAEVGRNSPKSDNHQMPNRSTTFDTKRRAGRIRQITQPEAKPTGTAPASAHPDEVRNAIDAIAISPPSAEHTQKANQMSPASSISGSCSSIILTNIKLTWNLVKVQQGLGRLRWSSSATGRVTSVLSFDRHTETRLDIAESCRSF